ncbi:MAG: glucose-6-phosphate isomerase [Gammaproteobacteria bacterium]|nr:glucose-6-phosphate isomerase [Gammaproteobacteria bacterium]
MSVLRESVAWKKLESHYRTMQAVHLRELFAQDEVRAARYTVEAAGWRLDYSKHRVNEATLKLLFDLARARGLEARRDAMFAGEKVNTTEQRAALHVALRAPAGTVMRVDGVNVVPEVQMVLKRMAACAGAIRAGAWRGYSGRPIRNIINIGIGGSDLGPVMAHEALRYYSDRRLQFRFVSNVDGTDFAEAVHGLRPDETLFIVASKTFTTLETMTNARTARDWLLAAAGRSKQAVAPHFVALSTNEQAVNAFGIPSEQMFGFWDWVGGRYSMDSAIGLSTMIAIGADAFGEMLGGFHAMDTHFRSAPLEQNLPAIMGLLNVWYADFFDTATVGVFPYAHYLKRFPAYLQQLTMESNGKHVTLAGQHVDYATGSVFWGEPGTNGQHSFYQLIHQGTRLIPCDFIAFGTALNPLGNHQDLLLANVIAQTEALAIGKTLEEVRAEGTDPRLAPHKVMEGNRPSSLLLAERLTPASLGALVALYEHSVFTQAAIWDTNPFDQWGVELGKKLALRVVEEIEAPSRALTHDASTNSAIRWYRAARKRPRTHTVQKRQRVLVLDVGGSHVKARVTGKKNEVKITSGPHMTPTLMLSRLDRRLRSWKYDVVSIGFPALIVHGRIANQPVNLGSGWMGFDLAGAFACPVKLINDAAMQALGSYEGGRMLFLGLGTGLGTAMIADGKLEPMELAHLPYKRRTYEDYVSEAALKRFGQRKWQAEVFAEIEVLRKALEPDYIVLGGGNVRLLKKLPKGVQRGNNANAFKGGFRLWENEI